jgi:hypothetical protein
MGQYYDDRTALSYLNARVYDGTLRQHLLCSTQCANMSAGPVEVWARARGLRGREKIVGCQVSPARPQAKAQGREA